MTWTALLGRWIDFAKASMAIPDADEGERWRASVAEIIRLQAVTFALAELDQLESDDRPFAIDRAAVVVETAATDLNTIWAGVPEPEEIAGLLNDARQALEQAPWRGATELVWFGPDVLVVPELPISPIGGTLAVMQPGTLALPGEPVAWWIDRDPAPLIAALPECRAESAVLPRQVYRVISDSGEIEEDVVVPVTSDPIAGLPLLVPICHRSELIGCFTVEAEPWRLQQEAAMGERVIPVRHSDV